MNKIMFFISWLGIISAIGIIVVVTYWLTYPYRVLEIKDPVFPILNKDKIIKQGRTLFFTSDNCKYMEVYATTSRSFVNNLVFYVPQTITNIRKGCGKVTISVPVASDLPTGKYYLHNIFQYKVNPIRIVTVEHNTEPFEVVE